MLEKIHGADVAQKENPIKRNYKQRMLSATKEEIVEELMRVKVSALQTDGRSS